MRLNNLPKFIFSWGIFLMMLFPIFTSCKKSSTEVLRSMEEQRMEFCNHIDSTSLREVINPDTIKGFESLSKLSAKAWILIDDSTGLLISSKNAGKQMYPASLTKMMTCLLALEHAHPDDSIKITEDVFLEKDGRVRLGDGFLEGNLIYEMMLQSDNDAAYALAKHISGSVPDFCKKMNERAGFLRLDSTHFANPNGMPNDSTFSSARDLLVLARYCMRDSVFAKIVGTSYMEIPLTDGRHLDIENTNLLLKRYKGCIGVKTGYTRKAGACLASAATRDGHTLFLVLLGSSTRWLRFTESMTLLDYGFAVMKAYDEHR